MTIEVNAIHDEKQIIFDMTLLYGTCISLDGAGVLLSGEPGAGKSDVALRLLQLGAKLVADDQVRVEVISRRLWVTPPDSIRGLLEVRGVGIVKVKAIDRTCLQLAINLVPREFVPRLPEIDHTTILGLSLPGYKLHAFDISTPEKIAVLVKALTSDLIVNS